MKPYSVKPVGYVCRRTAKLFQFLGMKRGFFYVVTNARDGEAFPFPMRTRRKANGVARRAARRLRVDRIRRELNSIMRRIGNEA